MEPGILCCVKYIVASEYQTENPSGGHFASMCVLLVQRVDACACSLCDGGREDQGQHVLQEQRDDSGHQGQNQGQWLAMFLQSHLKSVNERGSVTGVK